MAAEYIPIDSGTSGSGSGGSSNTGGSTSQQSASGGGGNIYVRLYIRQGKSSAAGKVRIQVQAYFYYAPYGSYPTATLKVYLGSNTSGTKLLDTYWGWTREGVGFHAVYSEWFNLPEQNNTSNLKIYALCRPAEGYAEVPYELSLGGIKNSHTLTIQTDGNISSYSYSIDDSSGVNGGKRTNQTAATAIVYDTDKVTWTATPKAGHKLDPASGTSTVSGKNLVISIIAKAMATIHMMKAGAWHLYSIYVRRGGAWVQHQANIRKAGSWQQYS